jgi:hypothetical protein
MLIFPASLRVGGCGQSLDSCVGIVVLSDALSREHGLITRCSQSMIAAIAMITASDGPQRSISQATTV